MAMNFPSSPTVGQTYSVSGGPTYTWDGSVWKVLTPGQQYSPQQFTATAGQTTFTVSGGYVIGAIDVFRNGVKLVSGSDYTATDLATVVLVNACSAGDTVEVIKLAQILYTDALKASNNLSDVSNAATARTNLGIGNVENKSSATIRGELTSGNVAAALGFTPANANSLDATKVSGRLPKTVDNTDHFGLDLSWQVGYANDWSGVAYANRIINLEPTAVPSINQSGVGGSFNWARLLYIQVKNNGENTYFSWHLALAQAKNNYSGGFFEQAWLTLVNPSALSVQVDRNTITLDGCTYQLHLGSSSSDTTPNSNTAFMPKLYLQTGSYRNYQRIIVLDWLDYYKSWASNSDW